MIEAESPFTVSWWYPQQQQKQHAKHFITIIGQVRLLAIILDYVLLNLPNFWTSYQPLPQLIHDPTQFWCFNECENSSALVTQVPAAKNGELARYDQT
jgi:hypothetical protein